MFDEITVFWLYVWCFLIFLVRAMLFEQLFSVTTCCTTKLYKEI